jgi:hypothetical protein
MRMLDGMCDGQRPKAVEEHETLGEFWTTVSICTRDGRCFCAEDSLAFRSSSARPRLCDVLTFLVSLFPRRHIDQSFYIAWKRHTIWQALCRISTVVHAQKAILPSEFLTPRPPDASAMRLSARSRLGFARGCRLEWQAYLIGPADVD